LLSILSAGRLPVCQFVRWHMASGDGQRASHGRASVGFAVGQIVEYFSTSQKGWIPAKIVGLSSQGDYDLDCKAGVRSDKLRRLASGKPQVDPISRPSADATVANVALSQTAPVQLLRVERRGDKWRYEVCPEGARFLESHGSRRISVTSICGLYRTGKSYLLNLLLERVQRGLPLFQVGSTTRACTEGLWLWGSLDQSSSGSPLVAFVDCEGFGSTESDSTRDAQLMTLCALLSSVLVLNTRGALNEGIFNALALTCRFAEHVEARGNEASRPELVWLLRDFQLDLVDASGCPISPSEYLEQALHAAPSVGHDSARGQAAVEVRQSLLRFFSQRRCMTLVRPAVEEEQLQALETQPYQSLRHDFRAGVETLRTQLVAMCHASPKCVGGQAIGCTAFVALMRQLVSALNENAVLNVRGAWETVQHSACADLADELRAKAVAVLRRLSAGQELPGGQRLPLAEEALAAVLRGQRAELGAEWDRRAVGDEPVRREYWRELEEAVEWEETAAQERNVRLADQQLTEQCRTWLKWLEDGAGVSAESKRMTEDLLRLMEQVPAAPLSRATKTLVEASCRRVSKEHELLMVTKERLAEAERQADAYSTAAAQQEALARAKLEEKNLELERALELLNQTLQSEQASVKAKEAELQKVKTQNGALLEDVESLRSLEHELKAQLRSFADKEACQQSELERLSAEVAKAETDRLSIERSTRMARLEAESGSAARKELEGRLEDARVARQKLERDLGKSSEDHAALQAKFEKLRREWEAGEGNQKKARESERAELLQTQQMLHKATAQLKDREAEAKEARVKLGTACADLEAARAREREEIRKLNRAHSEKEASWRENLDWVKAAAAKAESDRVASERAARKARWEADTALEERRWLEGEVKRLTHVQ